MARRTRVAYTIATATAMPRTPPSKASSSETTITEVERVRRTMAMNASTTMAERRNSVSLLSSRRSSMRALAATESELMRMMPDRKKMSCHPQPINVPMSTPAKRLNPVSVTATIVADLPARDRRLRDISIPMKNIKKVMPNSKITWTGTVSWRESTSSKRLTPRGS